MNKYLLLLIFYFTLVIKGSLYGQCPTATLPDTVCVGQPFDITNTTTGFQDYYWDFCTGDLNNSPVGSNIGNPGGLLNAPHQIEIVEDSGNFYGFVANYSNNNIIRLDYGNSPGNTPVAVPLNVSSLNGPTSIAIIKENNIWYALVGNYSSGDLVLVDLGSSVTNLNPATTTLGNTGFFFPMAMSVIKNSGDIFVFVANYSGNNITRLEFGNSILNTPVSNNIGGLFSQPFEMEIVYDCVNDKFIGISSNLGANFLTILDFGKNLELTPIITQLTGLPILSSTALEILYENGDWHILLTDEVADEFSHFNFGNNILSTTTPTLIYDGPLGGLSKPRGMYFINYESQWHGTITNFFNSITILNYPDTCNVLISSSSVINPSNITFLTSGLKELQLNATDTDGNTYFLTEEIYILEGPVSNFTYSALPCDNSFLFEDSSYSNTGSINSWFWDFGDGTTSTVENPAHTFLIPGNYNVKLTVTATSGCANTIEKIIFNDKPVASFSADDGCVVLPMQFINTSPDTQNVITAWYWDFGDNNSSNLENPAHFYATPGNYNVLLIAYIGACADTANVTVLYEPKPEVQFSVTKTCINQQQQFVNNTTISSGSISSYQWYFGDSNFSSQINPVHQYADTGNYIVTLIATGSNGCSDTLNKSIKISFQPTADFNYSPSVLCSESLVNFHNLSSAIGDTVNSWLWQFGTGDSSAVSDPVFSFDLPGQYNVSLLVNTGTDCIDSTSQLLIVEPSPTVAFSAPAVCLGDTTAFTDLSTTASGNLISWNWNFGNGDTSNLQNPSILYSSSGNFSVSLTVVSDIGCSSTDTVMVNVSPEPQAGFVMQNTCSNKYTHFFDASSVTSGSIVSWSWNFGDPLTGINNVSSLQNPSHHYEFPGNYTVTLEVESSEGCKNLITQLIEISRTPTANFSSSQACDGEPVSFTYLDNTFPTNATNWFWEFGNGATSSIDDPATFYLTWGTYNVSLIVADSSSGCSDTITKAIEVDPIPVPVIAQGTPCIGAPFIFTDSSYVATGSIQVWEWNINSTNYTVQNPQHTFQDTGSYQITLQVTSDKGCTATVTDTVTVSDLPTADFFFFPSYGDAPLPVNFINTSINAQSYLWDFGDGNISTQISPTHIFNDTGSFNITLIAVNEFGCMDTNINSIYIIQPMLDAAILKLFYILNGNYVTISAEVSNFGTREINSFIISARLGGQPSIQEMWEGSLKTGETIIYNFNASLEILDEDLNLICASILFPNGETDDNPLNNQYCTSIGDILEILSISPNPGIDMFTMQFNSPVSEQINIDIYDSKGAKVKNLFSGIATKGYNSLTFSSKAAGIGNGIYYIYLSSSTESVVSKLIIN